LCRPSGTDTNRRLAHEPGERAYRMQFPQPQYASHTYRGKNILDSSGQLLYHWGMKNEPKTLQQAIKYFANPDNCIAYLVARRWPNGVVCPTCGSSNVAFVASRRLWQCKTRHPKAQFSIKVGTIFEDSPISLENWLTAMWMVTCPPFLVQS